MNIIKDNMLIIAVIILTAAITTLATWNLAPVAHRCKILYVSQKELMQLEKDRIASMQLEQKELFFGKVERAVKLATELPKQYEKNDVKVLYSTGTISGNNVQSISGKIHREIIKQLQE